MSSLIFVNCIPIPVAENTQFLDMYLEQMNAVKFSCETEKDKCWTNDTDCFSDCYSSKLSLRNKILIYKTCTTNLGIKVGSHGAQPSKLISKNLILTIQKSSKLLTTYPKIPYTMIVKSPSVKESYSSFIRNSRIPFTSLRSSSPIVGLFCHPRQSFRPPNTTESETYIAIVHPIDSTI